MEERNDELAKEEKASGSEEYEEGPAYMSDGELGKVSGGQIFTGPIQLRQIVD